MKTITKTAIAAAAVGALALTGCSAADNAARNLSTAAEEFEVQRQITIINGITDKVLMEIEGRCSIETADSYVAGGLQAICRIGEDQYVTHFIGLSDNVTFIAQQNDAIDVSLYHHRVIIKPETVLPEIEFGAGEQ